MQSLKDKITNLVKEEASQYLGMSMTYSLFEFVKERFEELIQEQPEQTVIESNDIDKLKISDTQVSTKFLYTKIID